eukprot:5025024-Pleurochrysis_carterae.AAC.1
MSACTRVRVPTDVCLVVCLKTSTVCASVCKRARRWATVRAPARVKQRDAGDAAKRLAQRVLHTDTHVRRESETAGERFRGMGQGGGGFEAGGLIGASCFGNQKSSGNV